MASRPLTRGGLLAGSQWRWPCPPARPRRNAPRTRHTARTPPRTAWPSGEGLLVPGHCGYASGEKGDVQEHIINKRCWQLKAQAPSSRNALSLLPTARALSHHIARAQGRASASSRRRRPDANLSLKDIPEPPPSRTACAPVSFYSDKISGLQSAFVMMHRRALISLPLSNCRAWQTPLSISEERRLHVNRQQTITQSFKGMVKQEYMNQISSTRFS